MKRLLILLTLVVLSVPAFAQETENLVLGISPASATLCLGAGDSSVIKFLISTNVNVPQNITINFRGPNWAESEKDIQFSNTYDLFVRVSVPKDTKEGIYDISMLVCRESESNLNESLLTEACISPVIHVNVSSECQSEIKYNLKFLLSLILITIILILIIIFFLRRVSKIKNFKFSKLSKINRQ